MGHDRCYRNLITQKYYINSKTGGADFLDLATGDEFPNHWTRGCCGMGVLPANGLLYSTPYSCTCNVGDMFQGMNAYCADPELLESHDAGTIKREMRLEKGTRLREDRQPQRCRDGRLADLPRQRVSRRHDQRARSRPQLKVKWQAKLPTSPTASTIADGKVFVCDIDTHTALRTGQQQRRNLWTFTADGRIDSPPTYYKGMLLFGARDGWIYCLRAEDGELSWRFKDLPDRLIGAYGQLESAWPVFGSVLVLDDKVYAAAGRSSFLDGGIFLYCLDPVTGRAAEEPIRLRPFHEEDRVPDRGPVHGTATTAEERKASAEGSSTDRRTMHGFKNGILVSDGESIYLRHTTFDMDLANVEDREQSASAASGRIPGQQGPAPYRLHHSPTVSVVAKGTKDIMISDGEETYGVVGFPSVHNHSYFDPRTNSYKLIGKDLQVPLPINGRAMARQVM